MDVTGKQYVWYEYTFPVSTTFSKTRCVSKFLVSVVIGTCVDIDSFLFGSSAFALCPLT